ncbi:MAG TPA: hypothetical protein VIF15_04025 [Polyangiaceae bacterium]|jgi:hypothetical protein
MTTTTLATASLPLLTGAAAMARLDALEEGLVTGWDPAQQS